MNNDPTHAAGFPPTPTLTRLLRRLRRRLIVLIWLHGLGTVVAATLAWLALAFVLDWSLHVPVGIRWIHLAVLFGVPAWLVWRELVQPLRRVPGEAGMAVLVERERGGQDELLVSATQLRARLDRGEAPGGDPELARLVLEEAERRARDLRTQTVLDPRAPRLRVLGAVAILAVAALAVVQRPDYASIFAHRLLGGAARWPQRTHLTIEIPVVGDLAQVQVDADRIRVRVARGSDVPVLIRAEGVVPDEVVLQFEGGHDAVVSSTGAGIFRTVLGSCQEDLAFRVVGGDDQDGLPHVEIEVLQPPDVLAVALQVTPPAYTGLPPVLVDAGETQVVAGSRVRVHVLTEPADALGIARLLPEDRELTLESAPFPVEALPPDTHRTASSPPVSGLSFELVAERSLRYRFELVDASGLSNPDPGLFALNVLEDRAPTLQVIQPGRTDFETVPGGSLALRVLAEDDFGLASMRWTSRSVGDEKTDEAALPSGDLLLRALSADEPSGDGPRTGRAPSRAIAGTRLAVSQLAPDGSGAPGSDAGKGRGPIDEGRQFLLEVSARDNHLAPGASPGQGTGNVGRAAPVRIRIVSVDAMLRRVQDQLSRARVEATRLGELQREKRTRVEELQSALKSDSPLEGGDALALQAALTGQRRVMGDARSLSRELASVTSGVLYAGLDDKAGAMLEQLDRAQNAIVDRHFHPEIWRQLALDHREGRLGSPGLAGRLLQILDLSLAISEVHTEAATLELDRARNQLGAADVLAALVAAADQQTRAIAEIENLLERLSEWDNFQSVLLLTRDIVNRQKALRDRTKQLAGDK